MKKTIISVMLIFMMLFAGCQTEQGSAAGESETGKQTQESVSADSMEQDETGEVKGKYIEEICELPAEIEQVLDVTAQENGDLLLLTDVTVYRSEDGGESWSDEQMDLSEYSDGTSGMRIGRGIIDSKGNIFITYDMLLDDEHPWSRKQGVYISNNDERIVIADEEEGAGELSGFVFTEEKLIILEDVGNIIELDIATMERRTISESDTWDRAALKTAGGYLFINGYESSEIIEMDGSTVSLGEALTEMMAEESKLLSDLLIDDAKMEASEDGFYYCNKNGLYHYSFASSMYELLLSGTTNTIGDTGLELKGMTVTEDHACFMVFSDGEGSVYARNYYYSEDADVMPANELKVYSLYDNANVRQAINIFHRNNPDTYVTYETGVSEDSAITAADAKKTLVTNIMSGNGPDVLIMDGLSVDNFVDKDLLVDISDIVEEVNASEGLFEKIAEVFEKEDKIYAVPGRFSMPMIVGTDTALDSIETLDDLLQSVAGWEDQEAEHILGVYGEELLTMLYYLQSDGWSNDDGTLKQEEIRNYLEAAKQIQNEEGKSTEEINEWAEMKKERAVYNYDNRWAIENIAARYQEMALVTANSTIEFDTISGVQDHVDVSWKLLGNEQGKIFLPSGIISLSAMSENEEAKKFVKEYLSLDAQYLTLENGFPVNKSAFDKVFAAIDQDSVFTTYIITKDGEEKMFGWEPISEETASFIKEKAETLGVAYLQDDIIKEIIIEEGLKYLTDNADLEQTVESIEQRTGLYLAE